MIEFIFMLTRDDVTLAGRARGLRVDRATRRPPRRLQGRRAPAPRSSRRCMDDIRANGHDELSRGRLRDRGGHARVRPRGRRDPPRLPDRRHADRAGAGDPRGHRRSSSSRTSARSSATRACCAARSTRSSPTPSAPPRSASTASTCSPTATTATSRRSPARSSAPPTCRSSAPARSTPPSASARSRAAASGPSRSARPRSTARLSKARR